MVKTTPGGKPIGLAHQFRIVLNVTCSPSSTHGLTWIPNTVTPRARARDEVRGAISVDDFIGDSVSLVVTSAKAGLSSIQGLEGSSYAKADPSVQPSKEGKKRKRPAGKGPAASGLKAAETLRSRQIKRDGVGSIELTCLRCVGRGETDPHKKSYSVLRIKEMKKTKFATERNGALNLQCYICRAAGSAGQHTHWDERKK